MATKNKKTKRTFDLKNVELNIDYKKVKETTKEVNDFILETSEDIVEGAIKRGEEWTGVANKAVQGGLKLAATQQDLMFDTLESIKDQIMDSRKRFKVLFSKN